MWKACTTCTRVQWKKDFVSKRNTCRHCKNKKVNDYQTKKWLLSQREIETNNLEKHKKGFQRNNYCSFVLNLVDTCLHKIYIDNDVAGSINLVKKAISDILVNNIEMTDFIITKTLFKEDYKTKQPHSELIKKIKRRNEIRQIEYIPSIGDRISYIIMDGKTNAISDRAEDPRFAIENNIPIDYVYYIEHQLKNPIRAIFVPVIGEIETENLFHGEHTRRIIKRSFTDFICNSGIGQFFKK